MLKTAQVYLVERALVGGGLVTVVVAGDVSAVQAAVEAGASAVIRLDAQGLVSRNVIPRPDSQVRSVLFPARDGGEAMAPPLLQHSAPQPIVSEAEKLPDSSPVQPEPKLQPEKVTQPVTVPDAQGIVVELEEALPEQSPIDGSAPSEIQPLPVVDAPPISSADNTESAKDIQVQSEIVVEPEAQVILAEQDTETERLPDSTEEHQPEERSPEIMPQQAFEQLSEQDIIDQQEQEQVRRNPTKQHIDHLVERIGLDKALAVLEALTVPKLRLLTNEYQQITLSPSEIAKARKSLLIEHIGLCYQ